MNCLFPSTARCIRLVLACFWLIVVTGCSRPTAQVTSVEYRGNDATGVTLDFHVVVSNPTSFDLTAPEGGYEIHVAGKSLLKSKDVPQLSLPSGADENFTLPVRINYLKVFKLARKLQGKSKIPYELKGYLKVGTVVKVPFWHEGEIPVDSLQIRGL